MQARFLVLLLLIQGAGVKNDENMSGFNEIDLEASKNVKGKCFMDVTKHMKGLSFCS